MTRFQIQCRTLVVYTLLCLLFVLCIGNKHWWDIDFEGAPRSGKAPLNVTFTDKSILNIIQWDWDFPGAAPAKAEGKGPHTVQYKKAGQFDVMLTVLYYVGADTVPRQDSNTKMKYIQVTKPD